MLICGLVLWVNYLIGPYLMRFSLSEEIYKTFLMEVSHEILDVPLGIPVFDVECGSSMTELRYIFMGMLANT